MRFVVYKVPLDGTNDQVLQLPTSSVSLTFTADTSTVQLLVRPGDGSDFAPINSGGSLTLEPASGRPIAPCRIVLRAASAVTAYVLQGLE